MKNYDFDWQTDEFRFIAAHPIKRKTEKGIDKKQRYCRIKKVQEKEGITMKKWIALLLAVSLCAALAACGGTKNPDHDYVLSLMEKGDYDMAIQVLEHLREQAGGTASADAAQNTTPAETAAATEMPTEPSQPVITGQVQMATDLVNRFMEEKGNALVEAYENNAGKRARDISVSHALEYRLGNWDGFTVHFMLVCLEADICTDGFYEQVYLLADLDSGKIYDSTMLHDSIPDPAVTMDDVCLRATNAYMSYVMYNPGQVWADMEIREELTDADIAAVNEALK